MKMKVTLISADRCALSSLQVSFWSLLFWLCQSKCAIGWSFHSLPHTWPLLESNRSGVVREQPIMDCQSKGARTWKASWQLQSGQLTQPGNSFTFAGVSSRVFLIVHMETICVTYFTRHFLFVHIGLHICKDTLGVKVLFHCVFVFAFFFCCCSWSSFISLFVLLLTYYTLHFIFSDWMSQLPQLKLIMTCANNLFYSAKFLWHLLLLYREKKKGKQGNHALINTSGL